jgi:CheY-like chemotaxis protein
MRKQKILLVENEAIIGLLEKRQLEKEGYEVNHVFSSEKAIETLCKKKKRSI